MLQTEKEQTASQTISPTLSGTDSVNLFSGAGVYNYPINIPKGRNGLTPNVDLTYSNLNTNVNTISGLGWEITTGSIFRSSPHGINNLYVKDIYSVQFLGQNDKLIHEGNNHAPSQGGLKQGGHGEYKLQTEYNYWKYKYNETEDNWLLTDNVGNKYYFGTTENSKQQDETNPEKVFQWLIERIEDVNGNYIEYEYLNDKGQIYPKEIRYGGNSVENIKSIYKIKFELTANNKEKTSYRTGFKVETEKMLSKIKVYEELEEGTESLIKEYRLTYEEIDFVITNVLTKIQIFGTENLSYPATEFEYHEGGMIEGTIQKPGLLKKIKYPLGSSVELIYKSANTYQSEEYTTRIPFPIFTLHKVKKIDEVSETETETVYNYYGGQYYFNYTSAYKKEYAGFAKVVVTENNEREIARYFHQSETGTDNELSESKGEYEDHISKKGKQYREEIYDIKVTPKQLYKTTINKWDKTVLIETDEYDQSSNFVYLVKSTSINYNVLNENKTTGIEYEYDVYGNLKNQIDYGEVLLVENSTPARGGLSQGGLSQDKGEFVDVEEDKLVSDTTYI